MNRKEQIPETVRTQIDRLLKEAGEHFSNGNLAGSLVFALDAWNLIPEPKKHWDYYPQSLSRGFVEDFSTLNDKANTQKWIAIMAEMFDDPNHEDQDVLMTEGEAMFKLGDMERAYYVFDRIFEIYGKKGFAGDQKTYLDFYLKEKAARK